MEHKKSLQNDEQVAVRVQDLELWFENDHGAYQILNKISFDIRKGETLGIVGESGCGKSVTSLAIMRLLQSPPARLRGNILFEGKNLLTCSEKQMQRIRGNQISMIFQEPMTSLNPVYTIGNQLMEPFMLHQGLSRREAEKKAVEMLRMVRIPLPEQRVKEFPYQLSGGMRQRVMIAMALACQPELLIADEPTTALDVTIQAQVLDLMKQLQKEMHTAIAFITHDLGVVSEMCDRVVVLYCGEVMEEALIDDIFASPRHPYTVGLLNTLPKFSQKGKLPIIPGVVPPAGQFPKGCVFAPRCEHACEQCHSCKPELYDLGSGHKVRCFRYAEQQKEVL